MGNLHVKLPSGSTLEATMASFEECEALLSAFMHEAGAINIDLGKEFKGIKSFAELEAGSEIVNTIKNLLCQMIKSRVIKDLIFICAKRALYNGAHISKETFEPEEARGDYLTVLKEVAWFNLSPFLGSLNLKLSGIIQKISSSPQ